MNGGLEGVIAAETVLSHADGESGAVWVRGHTIERLAAEHGYEGAVAAMWEGFAGRGLTRAGLRQALANARAAAFARGGEWLSCSAPRPLAEGLRIALAALPDDAEPAAILATLPVAIAILVRNHAGKPPVAPDPSLATAADLLHMIAGAPLCSRACCCGRYLSCDRHRQWPRQFHLRGARRRLLARFARRRGAGWLLCVLRPAARRRAGLALDMLDEIEASGDIDGWIEQKLASGGRLMGFGHRIFRHRDPRADLLRAALKRLDPNSARLGFVIEVERHAVAALLSAVGRRVEANIEINARPPARRHRLAARRLHAGLCRRALRRLAGACHGAAADRPHDPPGLDLYRACPGPMSCRAPCAPLHKLRQKIAGKTNPMSASDPVSPEVQARILSEALPYMQRYDEETIVVKYGGRAMGEEQLARDFARDIVLLEQTAINPIVVHGGGPQIEAMLKKVGVQSQYAAGLRITDAKTLEIVEMVLAGSINKQMVGYINEAGGKAVGLCGKDGNMVVARKLTRTVVDPDSAIEQVIDLG